MKGIALSIFVVAFVLLVGCTSTNEPEGSETVCCEMTTYQGGENSTYGWNTAEQCKPPPAGSIGVTVKTVDDSNCE